MIGFENHIGKITVSENYLSEIVKHTVSDCFGVSELSPTTPFYAAMNALTFGKAYRSRKGVSIKTDKNGCLVIDLHIKVTYGTNITAAVNSIVHNVTFSVEEASGVTVSKVNVFVDEMTN